MGIPGRVASFCRAQRKAKTLRASHSAEDGSLHRRFGIGLNADRVSRLQCGRGLLKRPAADVAVFFHHLRRDVPNLGLDDPIRHTLLLQRGDGRVPSIVEANNALEPGSLQDRAPGRAPGSDVTSWVYFPVSAMPRENKVLRIGYTEALGR